MVVFLDLEFLVKKYDRFNYKPKPITKENFKKFGDMITTANIKPIEINNGYAKRYDGIANLNTKKDNGESTISIFSALKKDLFQ